MPQKQTGKVTYTCPLHPQVQKDKPGNCPICGMKLIPKKIKTASEPVLKKEEQTEMDMDMKKDTVPDKKKMTNMKMNMDSSMNMNKMEKEKEAEVERPKVFFQKGKTVRYDLYVRDTIVNFTGKLKHAYAINGSIPAPTLYFTEGDTAEIYLHNELKKEQTSLHWHGIILPNRADGVPYLTTAPVPAGTTHLYKFAIVQNGTYWYHSHSKLQEQAGMYGALVFKKREEIQVGNMSMKMNGSSMPMNNLFNAEYTMVLSEWTDENPGEVQRRLRSANDWYAINKGSVQSYLEAIRSGYFKTKATNEWKRMKAMDVSDVYYDRFLINGKPENSAPQFKTGDKVKLRVVNGGACCRNL